MSKIPVLHKLGVTAVGCAAFLFACNGAHAAGTIEIGLLTELTGPAALSGSHTVNGARARGR